jgi:hypothetical protein
LYALTSTWRRAAYGEEQPNARELAIAFLGALQAQPDLIGMRLRKEWIEAQYPLFCASLGVRWPPAYKDFAAELAELMDRKRADVRRKGKRKTFTTYLVPDPNAARALRGPAQEQDIAEVA